MVYHITPAECLGADRHLELVGIGHTLLIDPPGMNRGAKYPQF